MPVDSLTGAQIAYEYDAAGNIRHEGGMYPVDARLAAASLQVTYNDGNQMATCGGQPCGYDADGNLTIIGGGRWRAIYDPENRPVEITRGGQVSEYRYDGLGLRVGVAGPSGTRRFYHDPFGRLLLETDAEGQMVAQYIYAGGVLVARLGASGDVVYYHFDRNGSTLALTDGQGEVAAAYAYDAYGAVVGRMGDDRVVDDWGNPFTYVGALGVMDEGGGLFYMRARYYDALTGRFVQKDPSGMADGLNLYTYVSNNPVVWIDPEGQAKANWTVMLNGVTNAFVGGTLIFVGTTLAAVSGVLLIIMGLLMVTGVWHAMILALQGVIDATVTPL